MNRVRVVVIMATAIGTVMALTGGAQADPGRPNNHIEGDLPVGTALVKYSTYRTVPASWPNVDIYYDNKPDISIKLGLRHILGYQITDSVELGSTSRTYRLGTGIDAGTEFAINARSTDYAFGANDRHWGGQLYW